MKTILFSVLLGFAGFDPLGAMIVMPALSGEMPKAKARQFALMVLLFTVAVGVLLSTGLGKGIRHVFEALERLPDTVYVALDFAIAIAAGAWFVKRVFMKVRPTGERVKRKPMVASFAHKKLIERANQFLDKRNRRERLRKFTQWVISFFAFAVMVYFLVEPIVYLVHGKWIWPLCDPS